VQLVVPLAALPEAEPVDVLPLEPDDPADPPEIAAPDDGAPDVAVPDDPAPEAAAPEDAPEEAEPLPDAALGLAPVLPGVPQPAAPKHGSKRSKWRQKLRMSMLGSMYTPAANESKALC